MISRLYKSYISWEKSSDSYREDLCISVTKVERAGRLEQFLRGDSGLSSEETKNSSELSFHSSEVSFHSSEVSFHSSEVLFCPSVENFHFLVSYWGNTSGEIALNGDVGVAIDGVDSAT